MRKILALALLASLPGCAALGAGPVSIPAPIDLTDRTTLDEKAAISAEVTYTAASRLGVALVRAGVLDTERFKALDNKAWLALRAVRSAYASGTAPEYAMAIAKFNDAANAIIALAPKE